MGNPKKLSSYPGDLIAAIELLATSTERKGIKMTFPTRGKAVTFRSRFYTCRRLLANAREEQDEQLAMRIYSVGCRQLDDTTLELTNETSRLPDEVEAQLQAFLAEMAAEKVEKELSTKGLDSVEAGIGDTEKELPPNPYASENPYPEGKPKPLNPYLIDDEEEDEK